MIIVRRKPGIYSLHFSYEVGSYGRLITSAQSLLEIAVWVAENRDQLEQEAQTAKDEQDLNAVRMAAMKDPLSKQQSGFVIVKHEGVYRYHPRGLPGNPVSERTQWVENWVRSQGKWVLL